MTLLNGFMAQEVPNSSEFSTTTGWAFLPGTFISLVLLPLLCSQTLIFLFFQHLNTWDCGPQYHVYWRKTLYHIWSLDCWLTPDRTMQRECFKRYTTFSPNHHHKWKQANASTIAQKQQSLYLITPNKYKTNNFHLYNSDSLCYTLTPPRHTSIIRRKKGIRKQPIA